MISLDNDKIISLDKQLNYLNIKKEDGTFTRSLKLITKSFSFYIFWLSFWFFCLMRRRK